MRGRTRCSQNFYANHLVLLLRWLQFRSQGGGGPILSMMRQYGNQLYSQMQYTVDSTWQWGDEREKPILNRLSLATAISYLRIFQPNLTWHFVYEWNSTRPFCRSELRGGFGKRQKFFRFLFRNPSLTMISLLSRKYILILSHPPWLSIIWWNFAQTIREVGRKENCGLVSKLLLILALSQRRDTTANFCYPAEVRNWL